MAVPIELEERLWAMKNLSMTMSGGEAYGSLLSRLFLEERLADGNFAS